MLLARSVIVKQRFSKQYRHASLDAKLTVSRLKQATAAACVCITLLPQLLPSQQSTRLNLQEVRSMARARKLGVQTPGTAVLRHYGHTADSRVPCSHVPCSAVYGRPRRKLRVHAARARVQPQGTVAGWRIERRRCVLLEAVHSFLPISCSLSL
jgi:hypothetical protein